LSQFAKISSPVRHLWLVYSSGFFLAITKKMNYHHFPVTGKSVLAPQLIVVVVVPFLR
jgi:hypothetical protein